MGPRSRLGEFREREAMCAAAALGAREVRFLDFVDPSIEIREPPRPIDAGPEEFASAIAKHMAELRPDVIVTHGTNGSTGIPSTSTHTVTLSHPCREPCPKTS